MITKIVILTAIIILFLFLVFRKGQFEYSERECNVFASQKEAQRFYDQYGGREDYFNLDTDNDGVACEYLP